MGISTELSTEIVYKRGTKTRGTFYMEHKLIFKTLTLPYPPSVNHYKRAGRMTKTRTGKLYQPRVYTDETLLFFDKVRLCWLTQSDRNKMTGVISMTVYVSPPDKKKRDIDNICKVLLDSLQKAGAFVDDSQIDRLLIERMSPTPPRGYVTVTLSSNC